MLTLDEIKKLAILAKLEFLPEERFRDLLIELNTILTYIDKLKEFKIESKNKYANFRQQNIDTNRFQEDSTDIDFDKNIFIKRAPKSYGRYIVTDKVL